MTFAIAERVCSNAEGAGAIRLNATCSVPSLSKDGLPPFSLSLVAMIGGRTEGGFLCYNRIK